MRRLAGGGTNSEAAYVNGLDRLRLVLGWTVTVGWAISVGISFLDRSYNPPSTLHLLMMLIAGVLFGPTITGRDRR